MSIDMGITCGVLLVCGLTIFLFARLSELAIRKALQDRLMQQRSNIPLFQDNSTFVVRPMLIIGLAAQHANDPFHASAEMEEALPVYEKEEIQPPEYGDNFSVEIANAIRE